MTPSGSIPERFDLEALYAQLQVHLEAERWIDAIAICYRILNIEPGYRDVPLLLEGTRKQLALERERSRMAKEVWRGTLAPVMERTQPGRRHWLPMFLILGLGVCLLGAVLALFILRSQGRLPPTRARPEAAATVRSVQTPSAAMAVTDMQSYVNSEGQFLLKYPQGWVIKESPSEGQSLRIVIITPEARDQPERVTIFFAPGSGQNAEQVWISVLGFMQAMQDEEAEDWLLGEATSTSIGGYHARQIPFRYRYIESGTEWQGLIVGLVHDSMNYAFIAEAPTVRWLWAWSFFEPILNSIQFQ